METRAIYTAGTAESDDGPQSTGFLIEASATRKPLAHGAGKRTRPIDSPGLETPVAKRPAPNRDLPSALEADDSDDGEVLTP